MHTASIMSTSIFMEQSAVEDDYSTLQQPIPVVRSHISKTDSNVDRVYESCQVQRLLKVVQTSAEIK